MTQGDGLDEAIEQTLRVAMTSASRVGEALARVREHHQRQAAQESQARAAALTRRLEAEREAARATYRGVDDPAWWERVTPEQIAETYRTSTAWRDVDPQAAQVSKRIEDEVEKRYGLDVSNLEVGQVGPALAEAERQAKENDHHEAQAARDLAAAEAADRNASTHAGRERSAHAPGEALEERHGTLDDKATAAAMLAAAEREKLREAVLAGDLSPEEATEQWPQNDPFKDSAENANQATATVPYDSPQRREADAAAMTAKGVPADAVEAKNLADVSQGRPAADIGKTPTKAKARPSRGRSASQQRSIDRGRSR